MSTEQSSTPRGTGGVSCPNCEHVAPFVIFTDEEACPSCSTPLQDLITPDEGVENE